MPAGRPPIFDNPEQMQEAIDAYFAECAADEVPITVSGLAYALGMTTESLRYYGEKDAFSATVKRAKQKAELSIEQRLLTGQAAAGAIFNLKNNFGWKDKQEHELGGPDGGPIKTENTWVIQPVKVKDA